MDEKSNAIRYDWSSDAWAWIPIQGKLRAEHGRPVRPVDIEISTSTMAPGQAYDFWRETVFYTFQADSQSASGELFDARVQGLVAAETEFYRYRSSAISGHRTKRQANADKADGIDIGLVLSGQRSQEFPDGAEHVAGAGQLFFYDATAASKVRWTDHKGLHLSLRRDAVEAALGSKLPPSADIARMLGGVGRNRVLARQFAAFAGSLGDLDEQDKTFLINQTAQLALYTIGRIGLELGGRPRLSSAALLAAAQRYILGRLNSPHLEINEIAAALRCSRATLFRALAVHDTTPARLIQDMRLDQAQGLLRQAPLSLTNEELAARCGFANVRSFLRAFKGRFGLTPAQMRELILSGSAAGDFEISRHSIEISGHS